MLKEYSISLSLFLVPKSRSLVVDLVVSKQLHFSIVHGGNLIINKRMFLLKEFPIRSELKLGFQIFKFLHHKRHFERNIITFTYICLIWISIRGIGYPALLPPIGSYSKAKGYFKSLLEYSTAGTVKLSFTKTYNIPLVITPAGGGLKSFKPLMGSCFSLAAAI